MLWSLIQDIMAYGFDSLVVREGLIYFLLSLPVLLLSLSVHEAAHAYVAYRCGDPTAHMLGRMTLNPIKHIHPVGFLMLLTLGFGFAKPVPVNPRNYKNYRKDDLKVSMAGIGANLVLALLAALVLFILMGAMLAGDVAYSDVLHYGVEMFWMFVSTNIVLAFFNLIPVPPLDGYHLLNDLVLRRALFAPQMIQSVSMVLLVVLLRTGLVDSYLSFVQSHIVGGIMYAMETAYRFVGLL